MGATHTHRSAHDDDANITPQDEVFFHSSRIKAPSSKFDKSQEKELIERILEAAVSQMFHFFSPFGWKALAQSK